MATKRKNKCLQKAAPHEPIFVLRAQDQLAPEVIEFWASRLEVGVTDAFGPAAASSYEKIKTAREIAEEMRGWQRQYGKKLPD
jgi:hypothetical protein